MNEQEQTGADIGQEQEQEQEQAAPTMADAARLLAVLAESRMIGTGRKRSPRADYDAADVFADAAIELAQIAPAIIAEIVAAGIAGQTRQAPRESTIVPTIDDRGVVELPSSSPLATVCGSCGRGWLDEHTSDVTPVPSGRCPFEYDHPDEDSSIR